MKRVSVLLLLVTAAFAQTRSRLAEFALVLEDPPVAQKAQSRVALQSSAAQAHLQKIRGAQSRVCGRWASAIRSARHSGPIRAVTIQRMANPGCFTLATSVGTTGKR